MNETTNGGPLKRKFTKSLLFGAFAATGIAAGLLAALLVDHETRATLMAALESLKAGAATESAR